jgi:hypothetical protein
MSNSGKELEDADQLGLYFGFQNVGIEKLVFSCVSKDTKYIFRIAAEHLVELCKLPLRERPKEVRIDGLHDPVIISRIEALKASEKQANETGYAEETEDR